MGISPRLLPLIVSQSSMPGRKPPAWIAVSARSTVSAARHTSELWRSAIVGERIYPEIHTPERFEPIEQKLAEVIELEAVDPEQPEPEQVEHDPEAEATQDRRLTMNHCGKRY